MNEKQNHEHYQTAKAHLVALMQAGHPWHKAAARAGLQISRSTAYRLRHSARTRGEAAFQDGRQGHPAKLRENVRNFLQAFCCAAPQRPSREAGTAIHGGG
jgi:transposase